MAFLWKSSTWCRFLRAHFKAELLIIVFHMVFATVFAAALFTLTSSFMHCYMAWTTLRTAETLLPVLRSPVACRCGFIQSALTFVSVLMPSKASLTMSATACSGMCPFWTPSRSGSCRGPGICMRQCASSPSRLLPLALLPRRFLHRLIVLSRFTSAKTWALIVDQMSRSCTCKQ